jgi:ubiquitin-conjugating enzyme E2 Q
VDLLVSLAYTAAVEGVLEEPPTGMALRVPSPKSGFASTQTGIPLAPSANAQTSSEAGSDGLCDFDELSLPEVNVIGIFTTSYTDSNFYRCDRA